MPYIPRQYDSAKAFFHNTVPTLGNITDTMDIQRVQCYQLFDDMYYNRPEAYRVTLRGDSDTEIYLPSTRKIINSTARFLAVDFDFQIKGGQVDAVKTLLDNIFKREEVSKKFIKGKRSLLTRGDGAWYLTADKNKPKGERLSINTIHPSSIFPIEDLNNAYRVIGYHIVDTIHDPRDKTNDKSKLVARRQTYLKEGTRITSEVRTFELGAWDDRYLEANKLKPVSVILPKQLLPEQITALPVYFIPNDEPDGSSYGMSQVSGMEYIVNALNQSMTYEDLSLVLQGLGVYVTTSSPPVDKATGKPGNYKLHPGNVVEMSQGDTFDRVTGVASIAPFQDHIGSLDNWMMTGAGIPDMAAGNVDVAVAQSGIALSLKMGPILAENEDKQLTIGGKWDQLGYDLINGWLPAFEQIDSAGSTFTTTFGDPMPVDRSAYIQELIDLHTAGLLLIDEVREKLEKVGFKYSADVTQKLLDEQSSKAASALGDPYGNMTGSGTPDMIGLMTNGKSKTNGSKVSVN